MADLAAVILDMEAMVDTMTMDTGDMEAMAEDTVIIIIGTTTTVDIMDRGIEWINAVKWHKNHVTFLYSQQKDYILNKQL